MLGKTGGAEKIHGRVWEILAGGSDSFTVSQ